MNRIRVGTDCSGIEAPIQALKKLGIPFTHEFSSDIDKFCIQSIKANYQSARIFGDPSGPFPNGDVTQRNINEVPDIDLYVAGFPCQPFSAAGKRKGFDDKRGNVFWSCLEVITVKQPKYFVLENVKGLLHHDKGNTWRVIWESLKDLEHYGYTVQWKLLNTKDYGIPQSRERVFIVGTKGEFEWPTPVPMKPINEYIDVSNIGEYKLTERSLEYISRSSDGAVFVDLAYAGFKNRNATTAHMYCGCIAANHRLYCVPQNRYAAIEELLSLQGFPKD